MDEPVEDIIQQEHSKTAQGTTLGKTSTGRTSARQGIPHLETSFHPRKSATPGNDGWEGNSTVQSDRQDRVPWQAIVTFLNVSRDAGQRKTLIMGCLDL